MLMIETIFVLLPHDNLIRVFIWEGLLFGLCGMGLDFAPFVNERYLPDGDSYGGLEK